MDGGDVAFTAGPRSVGRVLALLGQLAATPRGVSLAALSAATGAPKTSLLGLLRGLAAEGYAVQRDGVWLLGPEAVGLARAILAAQPADDLVTAARPILERLADTAGESAMLSVLAPDGKAMIYADKVESRTALRFAATVGDRRPIHCTGAGRVMLAFRPAAWAEAWLKEARLGPVTAASVTQKRELRRLVAEVRERGVAVTLGEATDGVAGISGPVFDARGEVVASLVLAGPIARMEPKLKDLSRRVTEACRDLSRRLGHRSR
ncbi:MAG: IclR family transcriptional regulator [Acetobacteraceae bacterium]|nr:IclR family transcriptional regulator [Acetobacteraceae bacterium]